MIYNLTKVLEADLLIELLSVVDVKKLNIPVVEDTEYFKVTTTDKALQGQDGYQHPSNGDVFIQGDSAYGLDRILSSKKTGSDWKFELVIHALKKQVFSAEKSFSRPSL